MDQEKQRNRSLIAWLVLMVIFNTVTAGGLYRRFHPSAPHWAQFVFAEVSVLNVVSVAVLLRWKRWGFYALVATAVAILMVNLKIGFSVVQVLLGLGGVAILYGLLQIGGEKKAWTQLE
jgi:hypothetical protein